MPRARSAHRFGVLTPLLVLVNAAAGGAVWLAATSPIDTSPLAAAVDSAGSLPQGASHTDGVGERIVPELSALSETSARPLFRPDRRPPQPAEVVPEQNVSTESPPAIEATSPVVAPPPLPEGLRLIGVANLPRKPARVLLRMKSVRHGVWMSTGESVDGWRIAEIGSGEVWLEADGHRQLLSLEVSPRSSAQDGVATRPE